jgi:hypothetical protein
VLAKPPFQVIGNAGIDTAVEALDKIEEIHRLKFKIRLPAPDIFSYIVCIPCRF